MRLAPSLQTVKKLFACSGNRCALPDCTTPALVLRDGTLVAQICHIEAAEPKGERYRASMTDEERAASENLLLLCSICHTRTDDVSKFPVERMKELKRLHEEEYAGESPYLPPSGVAESALQKLVLTQNVTVAPGGAATQTGTITIQNGLTLESAAAVYRELWELQRPALIEHARIEADRRVRELENAMHAEFARRSVGESAVEKLADPAVQITLGNAAKNSAKRDSTELRAQLACLIADRLQIAEERQLLAMDRAVETIGNLTQRQIKMIGLIFALRYMKLQGSPSLADVVGRIFAGIVDHVFDKAADAKDVQYLEASGAVAVSAFQSVDLKGLLQEHYGHLLVAPIPIQNLNRLSPAAVKALIPCCATANLELRFVVQRAKLEESLTTNNVAEPERATVLALYSQTGDIVELLRPGYPAITDILELWKSASLDRINLNATGLAIAISLVEGISGERLPWDLWL